VDNSRDLDGHPRQAATPQMTDTPRRIGLARSILARPHCFSKGAVAWARLQLEKPRIA
jgi:hypothetical protein